VHAITVETAADSYPSGHTAFAAAAVFAIVAALLLTRRSIRRTLLVGVPVIIAVGGSRMYLGVHYLTDVAASVIFAGGTILAVYALTRSWLTTLTRAHRPHTSPGPATATSPAARPTSK